jgi:hypothetical protein
MLLDGDIIFINEEFFAIASRLYNSILCWPTAGGISVHNSFATAGSSRS